MEGVHIPSIGLVIVWIVAILWSIRDIYYHNHYRIPQQLAQLVTQAHTGENFKTLWDIQVSPEMRAALCQPLTSEHLEMMQASEAGTVSSSASCYVLSHKHRGNELSGVVKVTVTVHSRYSKTDSVYPDAKLRIVVRHNGKPYPKSCWEVVSVDQIA